MQVPIWLLIHELKIGNFLTIQYFSNFPAVFTLRFNKIATVVLIFALVFEFFFIVYSILSQFKVLQDIHKEAIHILKQ